METVGFQNRLKVSVFKTESHPEACAVLKVAQAWTNDYESEWAILQWSTAPAQWVVARLTFAGLEIASTEFGRAALKAGHTGRFEYDFDPNLKLSDVETGDWSPIRVRLGKAVCACCGQDPCEHGGDA